MTATGPTTASTTSSTTGTATGRARGLVALVLGPLWTVAVRDPVREGRLRLDALSRLERQAARVGLVLLLVLLGSMLLATAWRATDLLPIEGVFPRALVPGGVVGLTLLGLFVGWTLLVWGALDASPVVRLFVGAVFVLCLATVQRSQVVLGLGTDSWVAEHGPRLVQVAFLVVPGALVLSALLQRAPRVRRVVDAVLRVVSVVALATFLFVPLAIHADLSRTGQESGLPLVLDSTVDNLNGLTLPLLIVSAVVVVDLALDVSTSLAQPARLLPARWALGLLVALVVAKLAHQALTRRDVWADLVANQPASVVRTVLFLALLAALVLVATRAPRTDAFSRAKESVIYLGALVIAAPFLFFNALGQAGVVVLEATDSRSVTDAVAALPSDAISQWFPLVASVLLLGVGVLLMRRSRGGYGDEVGSAVVVVAGWNVAVSLFSATGTPIAFDFPTLDAVVTLGAVVAAVVVWRRRGTVSATTSLTLAAALVFTWLVTSRGDYISFVGGLLGLSSVLVVVVGIGYGLLSDSSFASDSSPRLPADARPMLYVGFLLVSVVLLHWGEVTHEVTGYGAADIGFFRIGVPLAAWYLGRRVLGLGDAAALQPSHDAPVDADTSGGPQAATVRR